ncbi:MAG: hypothetical protein ABF274_09765 [Nonlabens sp.]|uniref:hypothetical protein n=1 Tax=Nonlabens sp. TaxID=1888209 RepID=UPI00321BAAA6
MNITIHYPKQTKVGWSYRYLEVLKNDRRKDLVKSDSFYMLEVNPGDKIQVKSGMIKSNIIISENQTDLWIELSALAKYNSIVLLVLTLGVFVARSYVEWEFKTIFSLICVYTGLMCLWAYIMMKGNHIKIKATPLDSVKTSH